MANSDKNIVIRPSIGSTIDQPSITFTGAGNTSITLKILDDSDGTLSFEGYQGQVFAINNNIASGIIYSVNDISGLPIIDADASSNVRLGIYTGNIGIGTTSATSKLHVVGNSLLGNFRITQVGTGATVGGIGVTYFGDGSNLTGVSGGVSISTNTTNQTQYLTYAVSTGSTTGLGVNLSSLVFNPSTTRLGIGTTNPLGILQVGAGTSTFIITQVGTAVSVGIGTTNPQYIFTVTDTGTPATTGLTNCLADFTTTANSYGQINLRNTSTGTNASSDIIITANNGTDTTNFIDLGINNSGYSVGSWTINGANDGYLYTSDGNLSIGAINASVAKYISFFTGGTLISNERMRINSTGVGIGTTNPTSTLTVTGSGTTTTQLTVSGVSTFAGITTNTSTLFANQLSVSGVSTHVGISTFQSTLFGTQLSVSGVSTFAGITTNTSTLFANQLSVSGVSTFAGITTNTSTLFANQLSVSGVSTFAGITTVTGTTLFTRQLSVSGVSTHVGISTFQSTLFGTQASFTGIVTTGSFNVVSSGSTIFSITTTGAGSSFIFNVTSSTDVSLLGVKTDNSVAIGTNFTVTGVSTISNFRITPIGTGATAGGIGITYFGDGSNLTGVAAPNTGEFFTGITSSVRILPLSYETTVFTFPSTAGKQYVIESINAANVDTSVGVGTTANIIASIQDSTGEQTYIAYNVPIVNGGLLELLKNGMVAGPSDVIKMWATNTAYTGVSNAIEVYMNYTEYTSTAYFRDYASTVSIATTDLTTVYTSTTYPSVIESIHLANRTDTGDYPVSVTITNGTSTTYLARDLVIPRYATVDILDRPKRVELNGTIGIKVGQTSTIDVIIAGKQIT